MRRVQLRLLGSVSTLLAPILSGCGGELSASAPDSGAQQHPDVGMPRDAASDYHEDFPNKERWSAFQPPFLSPLTDLTRACFDGRYIYWGGVDSSTGGPTFPAVLVRYDSQAAFNDPTSWLLWKNFPGVSTESLVFDGRYVYTGFFRGQQQIRFDTQGTFGDKSALAITDPIPGASNLALGLATFDGRYVYYASCHPWMSTCVQPGLTERFDTQHDFLDLSAWSTFDAQISGASGPSLIVGQSLLLSPAWSPGSTQTGRLALYDTRLPFADSSSWKSISLPSVVGTEAFTGSGTDGRYVYFVPRTSSGKLGSPSGTVARFDTTANEWETFDTGTVSPLAKHYDHISWDGRYFYFIGGGTGTAVARYDTYGAFTDSHSWGVFDVGVLLPTNLPPITGAGGVVFDGEYVYMAAASDYHGPPLVFRFDARTGHAMPKGFSGTFY